MNPVGEFMQRLRNAAVQAVSEDDVREIFRELVAKAKKGDLQAAKMLLGYVLPTQPTLHAVAVQPAPPPPKRLRAIGGGEED